MKGKKLTHPFAPRIKKMMQADDDVGKIAQASPVLLGDWLPRGCLELSDTHFSSLVTLCLRALFMRGRQSPGAVPGAAL